MSKKVENVHIGEVKLAEPDAALQALLGSCVGLAIIWPRRRLFGLAHCLLNNSPKSTNEISGRYVDQAIRSLLTLMGATPSDYSQLQAIVAGGANMTKPEDTDQNQLVGFLNVKSAIEELSRLKIELVYQETGGINGRKIILSGTDGSYEVRSIPRPAAA